MNAGVTASFFRHFRGDPFFNMAFDEWMFREVLAHPDQVYVRLYTWEPGAITIGLNQRQEVAVDWNLVGATPVIRRITGGRALYHDPSECTYSLAVGSSAARGSGLAGSVSHASSRIAMALAAFLSAVGLSAEYAPVSTPEDATRLVGQKAACFASTARHELTANGRKIVASAQRRIGDCFLQHGSIKLAGIANHPALRGIHTRTESILQPLEREEFDAIASHFVVALAQGLGLLRVTELGGAGQLDRVTCIATELCDNPLSPRKIY